MCDRFIHVLSNTEIKCQHFGVTHREDAGKCAQAVGSGGSYFIIQFCLKHRFTAPWLDVGLNTPGWEYFRLPNGRVYCVGLHLLQF